MSRVVDGGCVGHLLETADPGGGGTVVEFGGALLAAIVVDAGEAGSERFWT